MTTNFETTINNNFRAAKAAIKSLNDAIEPLTIIDDIEDIIDSHGALPAYLHDGTPSTDVQGLIDVTKYAHSTFDLSKFTVVGTPTITDDGIASGISVNSSSNIDLSSSPTKWTIVSPTYQITTASTGVLIPFSWGNASTGSINFSLRPNGVIGMNYNHTTGTGTAATSSTNVVQLNTDIQCKWDYDNGTITMSYKIGNGDWVVLKTDTVSACTSSGAIEFSRISTNGCTCDLKKSAIFVDGVPVFSGNKTGIDTIKPDDYTVVGTPTISADGVASGFSGSNYILAPNTFLSANTWKIEYPVSSTQTNQAGILAILTDYCMQIVYTPGYKSINCALSSNGSSWNVGSESFVASELNTSQDSIFVIEYTGTQYELYFIQNGTIINGTTITNSNKLYASSKNLVLGSNRNLNSNTNGTIDLNAFKIYIDGNLVYQPCLKIPYTQSASKYGSKIVDSIYRDRVQDAWEQNFPHRYYTLDEANGNFTLPQGEIYGMIEQAKVASFPSNKYTSLTLGASGSTYTAPDTGWVHISQAFSDACNLVIATKYSDIDGICMRDQAGAGEILNAYIPVSKGQTFEVIYSGTLDTDDIYNRFMFIYPQGSERNV